MSSSIKDFLKTTPVYLIYKYFKLDKLAYRYRLIQEQQDWIKRNKTGFAPRLYKQKTVQDYGNRFGVTTLIETGTCKGEMVEACRNDYRKIISIELEDTLFAKAAQKFSSFSHIEILHGDSGKVLPQVLDRLNERCVFWLDGHYTDAGTAKGVLETPIVQEIESIFKHRIKNHVLLIDDARDFNGKHDYPTLDSFKNHLLSQRPGWTFEVKDDIIRFHEPI